MEQAGADADGTGAQSWKARAGADCGRHWNKTLGSANLERTYWEARAGADALLVKIITNTLLSPLINRSQLPIDIYETVTQ
jgi:hypothetical protein